MGNCLEGSTENAKCTGCGYQKCDCTDGNWSSTYCRRCDPSWKYQIPGTYDATYNAWLNSNPKPVPPAVYTRINNFPNILCQACTQCVEFTNLTANTVTTGSISQAQQCIANMKQALTAEQAAAERAAAERAAAERAAIEAAERNRKIMITILIIFIIAVVLFIIYYSGAVTGSAEVINLLKV